jgi:hypothetical protein
LQAGLWIVAGAGAALAGVAALADHRRTRRTNLDRVGWVPWPLLMILALIVAASATALALKTG